MDNQNLLEEYSIDLPYWKFGKGFASVVVNVKLYERVVSFELLIDGKSVFHYSTPREFLG